MEATTAWPQRARRGPPRCSSCTQWSSANAPSGTRNTCARAASSGRRTEAGGQQNLATCDIVETARVLHSAEEWLAGAVPRPMIEPEAEAWQQGPPCACPRRLQDPPRDTIARATERPRTSSIRGPPARVAPRPDQLAASRT
eukprot:4127490-Pyramimonas_sp.AAC.1